MVNGLNHDCARQRREKSVGAPDRTNLTGRSKGAQTPQLHNIESANTYDTHSTLTLLTF